MENLDLHGLAAAAELSLLAQVKELCWTEGRLAVGYPYLIILSFKIKKKKTLMNPW